MAELDAVAEQPATPGFLSLSSAWGRIAAPVNLTELLWEPNPGSGRALSAAAQTIRGGFGDQDPQQQIRGWFKAFALTVSDASAADIEHWADAFLANRSLQGGQVLRPSGDYGPSVTYEVDIGDRMTWGILEDLERNGTTFPGMDPERWSKSWDGWSAVFSIPTRA